MIKILMIGPDSAMLGGTTVSFKCLINDLKCQKPVSIDVISSQGIRGAGYKAIYRYIKLINKIFRSAKKCNIISFHAMPTALPYIGWVFPIVSKYYHKPLIYRAFGGLYYGDLSWPGRAIAEFMIKNTNLVLLQTKELMKRAENDKIFNVDYFPTARPMIKKEKKDVDKCKRFVFIGHLKVAKGLQYLAKAAERLPEDSFVDVYGPWYDLPKNTFDNCMKIKYKGVLKADDVLDTLDKYDALIFPSFMEEEGYSGIILEAYSVGIPVVATKWKALPEIVEDGKTGILIKPRSDDEILCAMKKLYYDLDYYLHLCGGVIEEREKYSQNDQTKKYIDLCSGLIKEQKK